MSTRLPRGGGALVVLALVVGCTTGPGGEGAGPATTGAGGTQSATAGPSATSQTAPTTSTVPEVRPVTVSFGGDVHFEDEVAARLEEDPRTTLGPISDVLGASDVAMVNLESAITRGGSPVPKTYNFRAPPEALRAGGVDVASMANNHGMDFGREGLRDTLAAEREERLPLVGIGRDAGQAYAPHIVNVRGQRLGFLGATQVLNGALIDEWTASGDQPGLASAKEAAGGLDRLTSAVRETQQRVDTVIVYLHWGSSGQACPSPRQQQLARTLIDAGADVLVGTHAHRLQAGGYLQGSYVHYGLGDFVWYSQAGAGSETGVLTLTLRGQDVVKAEWTPATIADAGVPEARTGEAAAQAREDWRDLRDCTDLSAQRQ